MFFAHISVNYCDIGVLKQSPDQSPVRRPNPPSIMWSHIFPFRRKSEQNFLVLAKMSRQACKYINITRLTCALRLPQLRRFQILTKTNSTAQKVAHTATCTSDLVGLVDYFQVQKKMET